jgi:hypothetical protein
VYHAFDGLAKSSDATVTITVSAVNHAPYLQGFTQNAFGATLQAGNSVGFVRGGDVDTGDAVTFTLVNDAGGAFAINPATGEITVANLAAFTAAPQGDFTIVARITDSRGASEFMTQTLRLPRDNPALFVFPPFFAGGGRGTTNTNLPPVNSRTSREDALLTIAPDSQGSSQHLGDFGSASAPTQASQAQAASQSRLVMTGQEGLALDDGFFFAQRTVATILPRGLSEWTQADDVAVENGTRGTQTRGPRLTLPLQLYDRLEEEMEQMARAFQPDDWTRSMVVTLTTGLSVGYVALSLRHLYLLASVLLSRPLWNSIDPLNVLDSWTTEEGRLLLGAGADDEEEELESVLGAGTGGRKQS